MSNVLSDLQVDHQDACFLLITHLLRNSLRCKEEHEKVIEVMFQG
jgi:hypothetical protein